MDDEKKQKTIIVLGAGASDDIKFPVGVKLLDEIAMLYHDDEFQKNVKRILWNNREVIRREGLLDHLPLKISKLLKHEDVHGYWTSKLDDINNWTTFLSSAQSIDEFIFFRKEYSILSKLGVIAAISKNENNSDFDLNESGFFRRTWYNTFWGLLLNGCNNFKDLKSKLKRLMIITFNYDRSFDYFLIRAITNYFEQTLKEENENLVSLLPINHVYGSIGSLNKDSESFVSYSPINFIDIPNEKSKYRLQSWNEYSFEPENTGKLGLYDQHLLELALNIQTYNESYVSKERELYNRSIREATHLYFFGFGFHDQNMSILFSDSLKKRPLINVLGGTCYNMPNTERKKVNMQFKKYLNNKSNIDMQWLSPRRRTLKIDDYIQDYGLIL